MRPERRITRWQGIRYDTGLAATAPPTARDERDRPNARASAWYDVIRPGGMRSSASHTLSWKLVPQTASRRGSAPAAASIENARDDGFGRGPVFVEARSRPAALELGADGLGIAPVVVGEAEGADAAFGLPDEAGAEGARVHAVRDVFALAALLEGAGTHRLVGDEEVVKPGGAREAGVIGGIEDRGGGFELRLRVVQRQELAEALGRDPRPPAKQALEVVGTEASRLRHLAKPRLIAEVLLEVEDGGFDTCVVARVPRDVGSGFCCCHGGPPEPPI